MAIFTEDLNFEVYMDEKEIANADPGGQRQEKLIPGIRRPEPMVFSTMHFQMASEYYCAVGENQATGTTYCRAYHLKMQDGVQKLMIAGIRYFDIMVKQDSQWLFAERKLKVCWIESR